MRANWRISGMMSFVSCGDELDEGPWTSPHPSQVKPQVTPATNGGPGRSRTIPDDVISHATATTTAATTAAVTSLGEALRAELTFIRLCGGFPFSERRPWLNRGSQAAYKCVAVIIFSNFLSLYYEDFNRILSESRANLQNIKFYRQFQDFALACALLSAFVSAFRYQRLFAIVLGKRLNKRYLADFVLAKEKNPTETRLEMTPAQVAGMSQFPGLGQVSSQLRKNLLISSSNLYDNFVLIDRIQKIRLARILTAIFFLWSSFIAVMQNDSKRLQAALQFTSKAGARAPNETSMAHKLLAITRPSWSATEQAEVGRNLSEFTTGDVGAKFQLESGTTTSSTGAPMMESIEAGDSAQAKNGTTQLYDWPPDWGQLRLLLGSVTVWLLEVSPKFLFHLAYSSFRLCLIYGHILVGFLITAALTDILRRVREQEEARDQPHNQLNAPADEAASGTESSVHSISSRAGGVQKESPVSNLIAYRHERLRQLARLQRSTTIILPTTRMLIQVRDVLIALRSALNLDYLFIQMLDLSRLMFIFGLSISLIGAGKPLVLIMSIASYLHLVFGLVIPRIGYHWLHEEARKIRCISERQLVECSIDLNDLHVDQEKLGHKLSASFSSSEPASSLAASYTSAYSSGCSTRSSCPSEILLAREKVAKSQGQRGRDSSYLLNEKKHVVALTNYRLAKEIETLWPTDWFTPDLKSYVSQNIFVVTFVATLHQLVETSSKVDLKGSPRFRTSSGI